MELLLLPGAAFHLGSRGFRSARMPLLHLLPVTSSGLVNRIAAFGGLCPQAERLPIGRLLLGWEAAKAGGFACSVRPMLVFSVGLDVSTALPERNHFWILSCLIANSSSGERHGQRLQCRWIWTTERTTAQRRIRTGGWVKTGQKLLGAGPRGFLPVGSRDVSTTSLHSESEWNGPVFYDLLQSNI